MKNKTKNKTIETQFIDWVVSAHPILNKAKISRKGPGENRAHVRFSTGCGITSEDDFLKLFEKLEYTKMPANEFSKSYTVGGYITWNNRQVGVLYGVAQEGHSERKRWSPESLGLNGFSTNDKDIFKNKILDGLANINEPETALFVSLLDNIEHNTPILDTKFLQTNKSKITSDFGEILAAYDDVVKGFEISFSDKSNQKVIDYYAIKGNEAQGISVKNPKGGGKVNLSDYLELIDVSGNDIHAKILYAIGSHNRDELFKLTSTVCPQVEKIAKIIGGTDNQARINYVKTHTYDEFYNQIKNDSSFIIKTETLGLPSEQEWKPDALTPRSLWANESLDPIDFTLNTLINRFWGNDNVEGISAVVTKFLNKPKFKVVDILGQDVIITEKEFKDVNKWKTVYWSRATKAWHNWMAVEPVKETK